MISNRLLTCVLVVILVGLVGVNLGCDKSPTAPSSHATPTVPPGAVLSVMSVSPNSGPPDVATEVRVTGIGFEHDTGVTFGGRAARIIDVSGTDIIATTPVHGLGTVDVTVTNPGGQSAVLRAGYTFGVFALNATPSLAASGDQLSVSWVAPSGRPTLGGGDWISLFLVGDPDSHWGWSEHLYGESSGTLTLRAPSRPGQYEFRYMVDHYSVARSGPVAVSASGSP